MIHSVSISFHNPEEISIFQISCFEMNDTPERIIFVNGHRYLICYVTQCIKQVNIPRALTTNILYSLR